MTPQHHLFHVLATAVKSLATNPSEVGLAFAPSILLESLVRAVQIDGSVRIAHACVVHDSVRCVLAEGDVELEVELQCQADKLEEVMVLERLMEEPEVSTSAAA